MAETPIVAAPSIRDIERAIEMEAAKPNPNLSVIKELVDTSKTILQQSMRVLCLFLRLPVLVL